ncbi:MAG: PDGLE domain-containing protein [Candidatus Geothermincolia bacterium]
MALDIKGNLKKNKGQWIFLCAALALAIVLALFVSPFASKSPDGLDKTAKDRGFSQKAEDSKNGSPLADYAVPGVDNGRTSTGLSGLLGVLITLGVALLVSAGVYGLGRIRGKTKDPGTGTTANEA